MTSLYHIRYSIDIMDTCSGATNSRHLAGMLHTRPWISVGGECGFIHLGLLKGDTNRLNLKQSEVSEIQTSPFGFSYKTSDIESHSD